MKLYIAEKPSLGRAIAAAMPQAQHKHDGYIKLSNGDCITWCIGHLLEQAEPASYDPSYKKWQAAVLPIIPPKWLLSPKTKTKKQLAVIKKLSKTATEFIHAGDPDREGQLLVDEVISYLKVPKAKVDAMQRCLISDLTPAAVKRALAAMRSNREFIPLSVSALARSRADWLYGINMTRAYTLQGQQVGYRGVLSVGRVQTPVLGLVVRRDLEIAQFVSKPFYEVQAQLQTKNNEEFKAKWQASEACLPYQDSNGRVLLKSLAENVVKRITDKPAVVSECQTKDKKRNPPLPFNLSSLQIEAGKAFSMSAKQVLDTCQSLYERHQLITYPRSDSRHLPALHYKERQVVIEAIACNVSQLARACTACDQSLKSSAFNDRKVDAHHAIIPTSKKSDVSRLNSDEQKIYQMIARQYLAQFYSAYRYQDTRVEVEIAGGLFTAHSEHLLDLGYKVLFKNNKKDAAVAVTPSGSKENPLPALKKGQILHCIKGELIEKMTQPPKPFSDATLLGAMTGISRFVASNEIRKILKETDGLGTEATRAGIIELLFKRQFLQRAGKQIISTEAGRALIVSLPEQATLPDMTAQWEAQLSDIIQQQLSYQQFMQALESSLKQLITLAFAQLPKALAGIKSGSKPKRFKKRAYRKKAAG